jgi:hypothetical protein
VGVGGGKNEGVDSYPHPHPYPLNLN